MLLRRKVPEREPRQAQVLEVGTARPAFGEVLREAGLERPVQTFLSRISHDIDRLLTVQDASPSLAVATRASARGFTGTMAPFRM
jgi:hypothetical protein